MYVKEINDVKQKLDNLKSSGSIKEWAIPYENLLTRLTAAIFFITPVAEGEEAMEEIANQLNEYAHFSYRINHEKKLSELKYRVTFSQEEKEKNLQPASEGVKA